VLGCFRKQAGRLNYCARLYAGQAIGSGLVEGACKNLIGKRLKQTAARWKLENVQEMAVLCCCAYSDFWTPLLDRRLTLPAGIFWRTRNGQVGWPRFAQALIGSIVHRHQ
jgi:hypothetical protein